MLVEMAFMGLLFLSGVTLVVSGGLRGWGILPLGYLSGLFFWVLLGAAFAVSGAPTVPGILLLGLVGLSVAVFLLTGLRSTLRLRDYAMILGGALSLMLSIWILWQAGHVKYHIDSFRYLLVTGLLAENQFELLNENLLTKRMLGAPLLHLPASMYEASHVVALTPLLGLSVLGSMAWYLWQARSHGPSWGVVVIVSLVVLLLATNNRFVWNSFYINAHLFVGAALMVLVGSLWLYARAADRVRCRFFLIIGCLAIPSLIVSRPEGFIIGALAIIPFVLRYDVGRFERSLLAFVYLFSTFVWFGYVGLAISAMGSTVPLSVLGPVVLGAGGLILVPLLWWDRLMEWHRVILWILEGALWVVLLGLSWLNADLMIDSLQATWENLFQGAGSWGASVAFLLGIVIYLLLLLRRQVPIEIRFPLTAMVPVFFLLSHLRGAAYRVGNGDSLNRMLIEVVPLAVLLVGVAMILYWGASHLQEGTHTASKDNNGNDEIA